MVEASLFGWYFLVTVGKCLRHYVDQSGRYLQEKESQQIQEIKEAEKAEELNMLQKKQELRDTHRKQHNRGPLLGATQLYNQQQVSHK